MRIKWSSEAALEIENQLERAGWAIEDCRGLISSVRAALDEANPDGENQAIAKASERFERDAVLMSKLADLLNDTLSGVKQADQTMSETESENAHRADNMEDGSGYRDRSWKPSAPAGRIDWSKVHAAPMSQMRIRTVPIPTWLDDMAADSQIFASLQ